MALAGQLLERLLVGHGEPGWGDALRRAAYLESMAGATDDAIFGVDADGALVDWNRGAERICGYRTDEVLGRQAQLLMPDWEHPAWRPLLDRVMSGETVERATIDLRRKDGGIVPATVTLAPVKTDGAVVGLAIIASDLSEQRFAQQTLEEAATRMAENEALAQTGTWIWDADTDVMQWSDEVHRLHGLSPDRFGGDRRAHIEAIHAGDRARVDARFSDAVGRGDRFDEEYRVQSADGVRWIYARGEPVRSHGGLLEGMRGICQDVTVRREAEDAIRSALELERAAAAELRAADRVKDEFLAIVSHELRTPLTAISGFASLLASNADVPAELIAPVVRNAREMEGMVERLLDFTRLEAKRIDVQLVPSLLLDEVERCVAQLEPLLADHDIRIDVPAPLEVRVDRDLVSHVLVNLVGNAAKFAPPGSAITIDARRDGRWVVVFVADEGRGVPDDLKERVFERFIQGPDQPNGKRGTGIGLSIVARCTALMGGTVSCTDGPNGGAVFSFSLPAA